MRQGVAGSRRRPPRSPRRGRRNHVLSAHEPPAGRGLWHTLAHLCALRAGTADSPGGRQKDPLRPNSKIAIMPGGEYCTYYPPGIPGDHILQSDIRCRPAPAPGQDCLPGGGGDPPCACRTLHLDLPKPASVAYGLFGNPNLLLPSPDGDSRYRIETDRIPVPRSVLDDDCMGLARHVMRIVVEDEARLCLNALSGMEQIDLRAEGALAPGMGDLARLLEEANAMRPADMQLDTVLLNGDSLARLAGRGPGPAAGAGEFTLRVSDTVPGGTVYAMPSAGGPELHRGPTAIECRRDEFSIRHYCVKGADPGGVRAALSGIGASG